MSSYHGGGIPFPGQQQYINPNAGYGAPAPGGFQMGAMPSSIPSAAPAADPYANAQPGTIAYAKSEGPDGIATYTPVIAQETIYHTPQGATRGIKWVTATSSQASAAGIPTGSITASSAAQLPQAAGMMPPMTVPAGALPGGYAPMSPEDDYPVMKPGMSQREYDKSVKRWEKDRRAAEKRARKEEKERGKHHRGVDRDAGWDRDAADPYGITGGHGEPRPRRMSAGGALGFERARRMSGGAALRDDELSRKLESLDMSFNTRRERRMSGGGYAPSAGGGGYRSRKGSMSEADRNRKMSGGYDQRPSFYPTGGMPGGGGYAAAVPGGYGAGARSVPASPARPHSAFPPATHHDELVPHGGPSPRPPYSRSRAPSPSMGSTYLPGGYGGAGGGYGGRDDRSHAGRDDRSYGGRDDRSYAGRDDRSYGGARDPPGAGSAYQYGAERTPYSTASMPLAGGPADSYALTRRPAAPPASAFPVSGRELNRAQPFTAFEEFFLVEDLRELLQPQPPPLPAALVPHDVMAEEWDRCMQGLIQMTSQAMQTGRSSALEPLMDLITQWNSTFFLPRGVDISIYKGNSRRSGPPMNMPSNLRSYDESESESESSSSSSSSTSSSEDDRYFSSARREQKAAKKAERKARRKEKARRRRARRRQRSVSIRVRAVPIH